MGIIAVIILYKEKYRQRRFAEAVQENEQNCNMRNDGHQYPGNTNGTSVFICQVPTQPIVVSTPSLLTLGGPTDRAICFSQLAKIEWCASFECTVGNRSSENGSSILTLFFAKGSVDRLSVSFFVSVCFCSVFVGASWKFRLGLACLVF